MSIKPSADVLNAIASLPVNRITVKPRVAPAPSVQPAPKAANQKAGNQPSNPSANSSASPALNPSRYYRPGAILDILV
jgi:hypothetical protein